MASLVAASEDIAPTANGGGGIAQTHLTLGQRFKSGPLAAQNMLPQQIRQIRPIWRIWQSQPLLFSDFPTFRQLLDRGIDLLVVRSRPARCTTLAIFSSQIRFADDKADSPVG
jgi:hypothetical protein